MMSKFNDLLHLRFKQKETSQPKMTALVERANNGDLSSFSGIFRVAELNEKERADIESILQTYRISNDYDVDSDCKALSALTSEVKAITNQAVILHGERIKKAQEILKKYQEGAFTAWLFSTYGNRQTPYNFLQYFEFFSLLPAALHPKLDQMPRQAVYTLASRNGAFAKKEEIVRTYNGEAKEELLKRIRIEFPLAEDDKRLPIFSKHALQFLKKAREMTKQARTSFTEEEKRQMQTLLQQIQQLLNS